MAKINEPKLIEIEKAKNVIFVGDTHGDLEASQKIIKDYLRPGNKIVFLGDYVDRGRFSKENLDFLLEIKEKYPNQTRAHNNFVLGRAHKICAPIYLLQGNHEGHHILKFSPAEFWESLNEKEYGKYCSIVEKFPLVVITKDIIALHGALPNLDKSILLRSNELFAQFKKIELGDENWFQICWGDFSDESGEYLGIDPFTGRPKFGRDYFFKLMERFQKKVLIRSHQPDCSQFMFDDRCLTIFTSSAYTRERTIAIADPTKEIKTAKDLEIKTL